MTSDFNFLKVVLNVKNEFRTFASFELFGTKFSNVDVKIDTGCPRTSFPVIKLGVSEESAYKMKKHDCNDDSVIKRISFGVNDSKVKIEEDKKKFKSKRFMDLNSISFKHHVKKFYLGNLNLHDLDVSVSYDRTGNILIGMDILKKLEIHIGTDANKNTVLLAKTLNHPDENFDSELEKLFHVKSL